MPHLRSDWKPALQGIHRYTKPSDHREADGKRNDNNRLSEQGKEHRLLRFSKRHKGRLAGKLKRHQKDSEKIYPKRAHSCFKQLRFTVEQMNKKLRYGKQNRPDRAGKYDTARTHKTDGFLYSFVFTGSIVESDHRLCAVGQAVHRHGNNFPDRIDYRHDSDVQIPSIPGEHSIADDLYRTVRHRHDKPGKSKSCNFPDQFPLSLISFLFSRKRT